MSVSSSDANNSIEGIDTMQPGPRSKPAEIHQLNGNPGKRPPPANIPKATKPIGAPPKHFIDRQKVAWRSAVRNAPAGLLTIMDRTALVIWVTSYDAHTEASKAVAKSGVIVKSPVKGEPMQNPYLSVMNRQAEIMIKAAAELGFSPASRTKVAGAASNSPAAGKFANNGVRV